MNISDKILFAREVRARRIKELNDQYQVVVSLRVNFPGKDKNHYLAHLIFNYFKESDLNFYYETKTVYDSVDGPYMLYGLNQDSENIKALTIQYEENHIFGRFYDIDVYEDGVALARNQKRQCLLCDQMAHVCIREEKHSLCDIIDYMASIVLSRYQIDLAQMIDYSMIEELSLEPKFGLVTKHSQGSHQDMNFDLMMKAKDAIKPYLIDMFLYSIKEKSMNRIVNEGVKLGKLAETKMYEATEGVNCYKGLIFHLGLIIMSYGYYLSRSTELTFIGCLKLMAQTLIKLLDDKQTFGNYALNTYGINGAKGEALSGYEHVLPLLNTNLSYLQKLVKLIISIDDTNLLKRAGSIEEYLAIKKLFIQLDVSDSESVKELSEKCINKGLSFGGSADMLVVSIFLDQCLQKHDKIYL